MFCKNCGAQLDEGAQFCKKCGTRTTNEPAVGGYSQPNVQQHKEETNVCAILGFIFAFLMPVVGLVLSIVGRGKQQYRSLATAGMVISILSIVTYIIVVIVVIAAAASVASSIPPSYYY